MVCGNLKALCWFIVVLHYPLVKSVLLYFIPKSMIEQIRSMDDMTKDTLTRRMELQTDRPDFISYIKRHNDENGMTDKEIHENSKSLIIAGSETSSTALSGVVNFLLGCPRCLSKLTEEVRDTFEAESEITAVRVGGLSYLTAALQEAIRIYPSVPDGIRRIVPNGGDFVGEEFIPGGGKLIRFLISCNLANHYLSITSISTLIRFLSQITVSMSMLGTHRSPANFTRPMEYVPERWLNSQVSDSQCQSCEFDGDNKLAFGGFSTGSRNCIGQNLAWMECRLIMARLIWNFDISRPAGLEHQDQDWIKQNTYLLWEKLPLEVVLTPVKKGLGEGVGVIS